MKLPISELMEQCTAEDINLTAEIDTEAVKEKTLARITAAKPARRRFRPTVLVAAAVVMTLLVGTAVASPAVLSGRDVEDVSETKHYDYNMVDGTYEESYWETARYAVELDIPADAKPQDNFVEFRLGWLPTEYEGRTLDTSYYKLDQWTREQVGTDLLLADPNSEGYMDVIPYQVTVYGLREEAFDTTYYFNGETTLIKQDNWNGWNRMELTVDYRSNEHWLKWELPVNYLLLYDPATNVFVKICGMMDMETLEQIAEHMEVRVTDEYNPYGRDGEAQPDHVDSLDMGRG